MLSGLMRAVFEICSFGFLQGVTRLLSYSNGVLLLFPTFRLSKEKNAQYEF